MQLINGVNALRFYLLIQLILGISIIACNKKSSSEKNENEIEFVLMQQGAAYLEEARYDQAKEVYSQFIEKYPTHPYVDDAAYRLAYLSVIADDRNPNFDYKNGLGLFQNFIESYPNSRYITACKNWVKLLTIVNRLSDEQSATKAGSGVNSAEINRLKNELKRVKAENASLQQTLEELQKAIER